MKNLRLEAIIIALGLAALGGFICKGVSMIVNKDRVVSVKGLAEKTVSADRAIFPIYFNNTGQDLNDLYAGIAESKGKIVSFLKYNGFTEDEIKVNSAPFITDYSLELYLDRRPDYRFLSKSVITLVTDKVNAVLKLIENQQELMKQGVLVKNGEYDSMIRFEFNGLNEIKPDMIEESTRNARVAAEKFAKDSDCTLGEIRKASQGQFSIQDLDPTTPHIKNVRVISNVEFYLK